MLRIVSPRPAALVHRFGPEVLAAALAGLGLLALWIPDELPMVDLPQHRAFAAVLEGLGRAPPDPAVAPFWRDRGGATWYGATYYRCAARLGGPGPAARLELSLALALWTAGGLAAARRLGASRRAAALAPPLFFGLGYAWGLLPWLLALPAIPWAVWAAAGLEDGRATRSVRARRWALLAAVVAVAAATHLVVAALAVLGAAAVRLPRGRDPRRWGAWAAGHALLSLPAVVPAVLQLGAGRPRVPLPPPPASWPTLGARLGELIQWSAPGPRFGAGLAWAAVAAAFGAVRFVAARRATDGAEAPRGRRGLAGWAGLLAAGALALPSQGADLVFAAERLVLPLFGAALLLVPADDIGPGPTAWSRVANGLWIAALGLGAVVLVLQIRSSVEFSRETAGLDRVVDLVPRGSRVLALPIEVDSPAYPRAVPLHLHTALRVVERRGGVVSLPPLANAGLAVELTDAGLGALVVPERGEGAGDRLLARLPTWDYVLVYARGGFPEDLFAGFAGRLTAMVPPGHGMEPWPGPWFLLRVVRGTARPPVDAPAGSWHAGGHENGIPATPVRHRDLDRGARRGSSPGG